MSRECVRVCHALWPAAVSRPRMPTAHMCGGPPSASPSYCERNCFLLELLGENMHLQTDSCSNYMHAVKQDVRHVYVQTSSLLHVLESLHLYNLLGRYQENLCTRRADEFGALVGPKLSKPKLITCCFCAGRKPHKNLAIASARASKRTCPPRSAEGEWAAAARRRRRAPAAPKTEYRTLQ